MLADRGEPAGAAARMTVETASISSAAVPPKKRDYSEYPGPAPSPPASSPAAELEPCSPSPASPASPPRPQLSPGELHALATKTAPLRSSGFMITDILSSASAGLPLPLGLPAASLSSLSSLQRVGSHSPHDSSDAGSYKDNDISDEGEEGKRLCSPVLCPLSPVIHAPLSQFCFSIL